MSYLKTIPGVAWVALLTALIGWLQGDWFAGQAWVPIVVVVLSAIAQIIRILLPDPQFRSTVRTVSQSKVSRVVWGDKSGR